MSRIKPPTLFQQSKKKKGQSKINVTTIAIYDIVVVVMAFFLFSTYRHWSRRCAACEEFDTWTDCEFTGVYILLNAVIITSKGSISVELYKEGSPKVYEFIDSCQKGSFKGMLFNRVLENFIIQAGNIDRHR